MPPEPISFPEPIAVYALTAPGTGIARRIAAGGAEARLFLPERLATPGTAEVPFRNFREALTENFRKYRGHVIIAATGVVVRTMAPLIDHKAVDPAIVVVDPHGRYAISLLSGHLGRANLLAKSVAQVLGGQAVITTATDASGQPALEVLAADLELKIRNWPALAPLARSLVEGRPVPVYDPEEWLWPSLSPWSGSFVRILELDHHLPPTPLVHVSHQGGVFPDGWLLLRPPCLYLGLGCNRGTSFEEIHGLVMKVLEQQALDVLSLAGVASIEAKRDEPGLLTLAKTLNSGIKFFAPADLAKVPAPNPSATVKKHVGVPSVCEAAALLAAESHQLLVPKQKSLNATLAVAHIGSKLSA